jgi:predicted CopG family antitoxin
MKKWIILDWAGRRCFTGKAFDTYEQGWDFLFQTFPSEDGDDNEDELGEYRVVEDSTPHHDLNALGNAVLNQIESDLQNGDDFNPWSELIEVLCEREENIEILRDYLSNTARQNLDEGKTNLRYDEEMSFANIKLKLGYSKSL